MQLHTTASHYGCWGGGLESSLDSSPSQNPTRTQRCPLIQAGAAPRCAAQKKPALPGGEQTCFLTSLQLEDVVSHPWHPSQLSHVDHSLRQIMVPLLHPIPDTFPALAQWPKLYDKPRSHSSGMRGGAIEPFPKET